MWTVANFIEVRVRPHVVHRCNKHMKLV